MHMAQHRFSLSESWLLLPKYSEEIANLIKLKYGRHQEGSFCTYSQMRKKCTWPNTDFQKSWLLLPKISEEISCWEKVILVVYIKDEWRMDMFANIFSLCFNFCTLQFWIYFY
jgi:hypothetical protein